MVTSVYLQGMPKGRPLSVDAPVVLTTRVSRAVARDVEAQPLKTSEFVRLAIEHYLTHIHDIHDKHEGSEHG